MSKSVLIVEDDKLISSVIEAVLEQAGYSTLMAFDGLQAKAMLEQKKPDLITLDINMPEMSGLEFLELMKPTDYLEGVKIILVSGLPVGDLIDALVTGADWVYEKPVAPDRLLDKVVELIGEA
ncbi:MAG: response regulator [Gammaproteobacteria bacterium]|nr:response regulator [Gammaproteobacteria bacterium]